MRLLCSALLLVSSATAQTSADAVADRMLARVAGAQWGERYVASANCQPRLPYQQTFGAQGEWSEHCIVHVNGLLEESLFYAFDDSAAVRLRVEVRPESSAPPSADVVRALRDRLTRQFGPPTHEPQMMEIGLPAAGDHWSSNSRHYFLFENPSGRPNGVRGEMQLIAVDGRLFGEIKKDALVEQSDIMFHQDAVARPFFAQLLGDAYMRLIDASPKTPVERQSLAAQTSREALGLLDVASRALLDEKAMLLLAANALVAKLSTVLWINDEKGEHEIPEAAAIRVQLAKFGVQLGGMLHNNGVLAYNQDLLWRVWREFPDTQAGQLAFVELQQRGWYNYSDKGCPSNPDVFHDVIEHGEAFLAQHPSTPFRKDVLFTLAVANESWWSVAHAPADDPTVSGAPYPRKEINQRQAESARQRAIDYYEQIVKLAPESPEAASAGRRLPRMKLGLDTGQRRFFCSFD
jgi:hypothetical protein